MKVCVVLLNWNGWQDTVECLESLLKSSYRNFSIIICDNSSTDNSIELITDWVNKNVGASNLTNLTENNVRNEQTTATSTLITLVSNNSNHGFAKGNNIGIKLALKDNKCELVWLLNNDTIIENDALKNLVNRVRLDNKIGICGSLLCFYHDRSIIQAIGGVKFNIFLARGQQIGQGLRADSIAGKPTESNNLTYIAGASMLVRRELIVDIGYMEEKYFLYFEEIDWATRCASKWTLATAHDSVVYHKEGGSIGTSSLSTRSPLSQYYLNRNLIIFYIKFYPILLPIAILRVCREAYSNAISRNHLLFRTTCKALLDGLMPRDGIRKDK